MIKTTENIHQMLILYGIYRLNKKKGTIMNYGKSIRLFLIEGIADGRWMCELSNWTGKAYKIPRKYVKSSNDRPELANTGIYFLFGKSDDRDTYRVYIGEAENIYERLNTHLKEKDF